MQYRDLITQFVYESFPSLVKDANPAVRFEAISAAIFGTKQRRFGPMPPPETQVQVRNAIRDTPNGAPIQFFMPWGSSKQGDGDELDILELMALKQLQCLRDDLARLGRDSTFQFRVENVTDHYLFGNGRLDQIETYAQSFTRLAKAILPGSMPILESQFVCGSTFTSKADEYAPVFYRYLNSDRTPDDLKLLKDIGWAGSIPTDQLEYYTTAYKLFYPGADYLWKAAQYFAATLARVTLGATAAPKGPSILIAFTHPVPSNPINKARLHYRTLPERHTNQHKSPWLARGVFRVEDDNSVNVRYYEGQDITPNTVEVAGVKVQVPYYCG